MSRPSLGSVRALGYVIWAHCDRQGCGHGSELDLEALIGRYGVEVEAVELNGRLVCQRCGWRGGRITIAPAWRLGS